MISGSQGFRLTKASKLSIETAPVKAFLYFYNAVVVAGQLPGTLEVRHEGSCGRCGRKLTVPASIDAGIGPECAGKLGGLASAAQASLPLPRGKRLEQAMRSAGHLLSEGETDAELAKARPSRKLLPLSQTGFFGDKVAGKGTSLNDPLPTEWRF